MGNFLNFDNLITPRIMKLLYVLGTILIVLGTLAGVAVAGIGGIITAIRTEQYSMILLALVMVVVYLIVGVLWAIMYRVWCEVLIIIFKINENLAAMRQNKG